MPKGNSGHGPICWLYRTRVRAARRPLRARWEAADARKAASQAFRFVRSGLCRPLDHPGPDHAQEAAPIRAPMLAIRRLAEHDILNPEPPLSLSARLVICHRGPGAVVPGRKGETPQR